MEPEKMSGEEREQANIYKTLLRDFIIINVTSGIAVFIMFIVMLLQRYDFLPMLPCGIHEILHVYCPGCGGTRALFALLNGHIIKSLYYNPAIFLGAILIFYYEIGVIITLMKKNGKYYYYQKGWLVYEYMIIIVIFTVMRDYLLISSGIDMLGDFI